MAQERERSGQRTGCHARLLGTEVATAVTVAVSNGDFIFRGMKEMRIEREREREGESQEGRSILECSFGVATT